MQLGSFTRESPLDKEPAGLPLTLKAVDPYIQCPQPQHKPTACGAPIQATRSAPMGLWAGMWWKNAGVQAICCATRLKGSLSLTQESYDFCHHPWNSKRLNWLPCELMKIKPQAHRWLYLPQQKFSSEGKGKNVYFPPHEFHCFSEPSLKYNTWVKAL